MPGYFDLWNFHQIFRSVKGLKIKCTLVVLLGQKIYYIAHKSCNHGFNCFKPLFYFADLVLNIVMFGEESSFKHCNFFCSDLTRVLGITHNISARRWEGDRFDARPEPRHS